MRHILLSLLTSLGFAASVQTASPQQAADLTGLLNVEGQAVADASTSPNVPDNSQLCQNLNSVTGRVVSAMVIQMPGVDCWGDPYWYTGKSFGHRHGNVTSTRLGQATPRGNGAVTMNVHLADPADASKMQPGKMVTLSAVFRVVTFNHVDYLIADNAKYLHGDPFGR